MFLRPKTKTISIRLTLFCLVFMLNTAHAILLPAQKTYLNRQITQSLHDKEEQQMVFEWDEAEQVAEFICRPIALAVIQKTAPLADKVFLGDAKKESLTLKSAHELVGTGQYRTGFEWTTFKFTCKINEKTGKAGDFLFQKSPSYRLTIFDPI